MVCQLIELFNSFDVSTDNGFIFLEDSDGSINLNIRELFVFKLFQSSGNFVFLLLVEDDFKSSGIIVDLKNSAHGLLKALDHSPDNDNVVNGFSVDFADVVRAGAWVLDHFHGDWGEESVFAALAGIIARSFSVAFPEVILFESGAWTESTPEGSWVVELLKKNLDEWEVEFIKN